MRYALNETLFAIHFDFPDNAPNAVKVFRMPMRFDAVAPNKITIVRLEVKEHHKVPWDQDPSGVKNHDGFLLKDDIGREFANQYPFASYGQTTTHADQMFRLSASMKELKESDDAIYSYRHLGDVMETIEAGIKHLSASWFPEDKNRAEALTKVRDDIKEQFAKMFPEYTMTMTMEKLVEDSDIMHETCTIKFS